MVSAVHHQGRRLYELAREGITVEREPRRVTIHSLVLSDFTPGPHPEATLRVVCGGGTYIRTLCADIGEALGVGGHMKALAREAVGRFRRAEALALDAPAGAWPSHLLPMEAALDLPAHEVTAEEDERLGRGQAIPAPVDSPLVMLTFQGVLRALARSEEGTLQPFRVFNREKDDG